MRWGEPLNEWDTAELLHILDHSAQLKQAVLQAHHQKNIDEQAQESLVVLLSHCGPNEVFDVTLRFLVTQELPAGSAPDSLSSQLELLQIVAVCRYFALHLGLDTHLLTTIGTLRHLQAKDNSARRYPAMIALVLALIERAGSSVHEGVEIDTFVHVVSLAQSLALALKKSHPLNDVPLIEKSEAALQLELSANHLKILLAALLTFNHKSELLGEEFCAFIQEKSDLPKLLIKRSLLLLIEQSSQAPFSLSAYSKSILSTNEIPHSSRLTTNLESELELEPLLAAQPHSQTGANNNASIPRPNKNSTQSIRLPPLSRPIPNETSATQAILSSPSTLRQNSQAKNQSATCSSTQMLSLSFDQKAKTFTLPYQKKEKKCAICSKRAPGKTCPVCGSHTCHQHANHKNYWCNLCEKDYRRLRGALRPPLELQLVGACGATFILIAGYYFGQEQGLAVVFASLILLYAIASLTLRGVTKMQIRAQRSKLFYQQRQEYHPHSSHTLNHSSLAPAVRPLAVTPMIQADLEAEAVRNRNRSAPEQFHKTSDEQPPNTIASADDFKETVKSDKGLGAQFPGPFSYGGTSSANLAAFEFGTSPPPSASFIRPGSVGKRQ